MTVLHLRFLAALAARVDGLGGVVHVAVLRGNGASNSELVVEVRISD